MSQNDIVRGKDDQKVKDLAYSIASVAHQHLETVCIYCTILQYTGFPLQRVQLQRTIFFLVVSGIQYKLMVNLCVKLFGHEK